MNNIESKILSQTDITLLAYDVLRERRLAFDSLMWQSPALGIAAQSFLLSIAFDSSKGTGSCLICALLSIGLGLCSMQLMLKHRYHEKLTTLALHKIELDHALIPIHERPTRATKDMPFGQIINISSFKLWMWGLLITTCAGAIALLITILSA